MKWSDLLKIIGPLLLVFILLKIDFSQLWLALRNLNWIYFILSLVFWFSQLYLRTFKWKMIVDFIGERVSFRRLLLMLTQGVFWGLITPGKFGEFYRAKYLEKNSNLSLKKCFWTVFLDRIIDVLGAAFLSVIAALLLVYLIGVKLPFIIIVCLFSIFFLVTCSFIFKKQSKDVLKIALSFFIPKFLKEKIHSSIEEIFEELGRIKLPFLFILFGYELIYYLFSASAQFFLALSLGLHIPFWYLYFIGPFVSLVVILPISVLGLGTRETTYIFLLAPFGIILSQAVTFSLLVMFLDIIIALPGLFIYLLKK